jgi:hypothetical protein
MLDVVIAYLDDRNAWAAERLAREPGWVLDAALSHAGNSKVFATYLHSVSAHEIAELRLGKKTEQLHAQAEKLHRQLDRYAYGPPPVRFTDGDVDQARAAGVLIEFERARPIIVDRALYRELVKAAVKRAHDELEAKAAVAARDKKTAGANAPADPLAVAKRERDAQLRELTDQAHGANLDLGHALIHNLTTVDRRTWTSHGSSCYAEIGIGRTMRTSRLCRCAARRPQEEGAPSAARPARGDEQGRDSFDTSDLLPLFCRFAAGAEAIASVAERLAPISTRSKRLVHERVTCARDGSP